ncbi:MAG: aminotransferase class V-fold PLP-dependent enzyme [Pseudomonadota bacterium]
MIAALSNRADYASLAQATYLNQASLGLTPAPAVAAMHAYLDSVGQHGNLHLSDADELALLTPLREAASQLFNCPPAQLAIVSGASELLSQLPYLLRLPRGGHVLCTDGDFPALTRPWLALATRSDTTVRFVAESADQDLTDTLINQLDKHTAVLAVSHVQFSTGSRVDVPRLRDATRANGTQLVVDVTQSAGALPIDTTAWDADAVVSSGYKWLGGQGGVGLAVLSPTLARQTPAMPGWMGAPDPFDTQPTQLALADGAQRFTQSTMSYSAVTGLAVTVSELNRLGATAIEHHASQLSRYLYETLNSSQWTAFRAPSDRAAAPHIVSLAHPNAKAASVVTRLRQAGVVCSARQGRVRVSLAHYNTDTDINTLVSALCAASQCN